MLGTFREVCTKVTWYKCRGFCISFQNAEFFLQAFLRKNTPAEYKNFACKYREIMGIQQNPGSSRVPFKTGILKALVAPC